MYLSNPSATGMMWRRVNFNGSKAGLDSEFIFLLDWLLNFLVFYQQLVMSWIHSLLLVPSNLIQPVASYLKRRWTPPSKLYFSTAVRGAMKGNYSAWYSDDLIGYGTTQQHTHVNTVFMMYSQITKLNKITLLYQYSLPKGIISLFL